MGDQRRAVPGPDPRRWSRDAFNGLVNSLLGLIQGGPRLRQCRFHCCPGLAASHLGSQEAALCAGLIPLRSALQTNNLRFHSTRFDLELRERDGQVEASRSNAAWIEVEHTIVHFDERLMRVAKHNGRNAFSDGIDCKLRAIMDHVDHRPSDIESPRQG
jgi:hypothetical protein